MSGERWYYFGCGDQTGHYLFGENRWKVNTQGKDAPPRRMESHFDGTLPPQGGKLYVASFSVLGGWGMCALSWWDCSVDKRVGSNSIVFAPGLNWTPEGMLAEAENRFPWVFSRLPQPLALAPQPTGGDHGE